MTKLSAPPHFPYSSDPDTAALIILEHAGGDASQIEPLLRRYMREHGKDIGHVGLSQAGFRREVEALVRAQIGTYRPGLPEGWHLMDDGGDEDE